MVVVSVDGGSFEVWFSICPGVCVMVECVGDRWRVSDVVAATAAADDADAKIVQVLRWLLRTMRLLWQC